MTSPEAEAARRPRFRAGGCALRLAIVAIVATVIVVAIGFAFDQGDNAHQPQQGFDAGPPSSYQPGSVSYIEQQRLFVVHLPDGSFRALYDRSPRQQELNGDCRVHFDDTAGIGTLEPIAGMTGAFVEDCNEARSVWRADGVFAFGNGYGDLDRYETSVDAGGSLIVDTSSRTCTRSRGVPGLPPFDVKQCGQGE